MTDRTMSMMVYEDWRPKLSPEAIAYFAGMQNAYPNCYLGSDGVSGMQNAAQVSYPAGVYRPMTEEEMQKFGMQGSGLVDSVLSFFGL